MKITIYTISDCYFSKQEKDYLASHQLAFEEKNLEENREYLTEMLTISNNFAGTPVTKVEKDDGNIVILKGFTKEEFDQTFGFVASSTDTVVPTQSAQDPVVEAPAVTPPPPPPVMPEPTPVVPPPAPVTPAQDETPSPQAPTPPQPDLSSIAAQIEQLKKLQESLTQQTSVVTPPQPVAPPVIVQPAPAPVVEAPTPVTPVPVVQAPAPQAPAANVDDSLAAILAELQSKINSSAPTGGTGTTPPATS